MDITDKLVRGIKISSGDIFFTKDISKNVLPGQQYKDYPAIVWKIFYKYKPWYKFWKKKEVEGISVLWLGEEYK